MILIGLILLIAFIVVATSFLKWHPFLVLLLASLFAALYYQIPLTDIPKTIGTGFGGLLGNIGIVIVLGTIIGVILEKTGAAIVMADMVVKLMGKRYPTLAMAIVGAIVSIPVFCDSGFVILNSLKNGLSKRLGVSALALSTALAGGLYVTHNLVPPTPGPIAAAGTLGLTSQMGLVIGVGLLISVPGVLVAWLWSQRFLKETPDLEETVTEPEDIEEELAHPAAHHLPSPFMAGLPILLPIILIAVASVAAYPSHPLGQGSLANVVAFLGQPLIALLIGLFVALLLLRNGTDPVMQRLNEAIVKGLTVSAPIILISGAGGALGAVLKNSPLGDYLGTTLSSMGLGIFMPFVVSSALKTAQGSSTVAMVTAAVIVEPLLNDLGMGSDMARVLVTMAIASGALTISHANDSFFWAVTQLSKMSAPQCFRTITVVTALQGVIMMFFIWLLSLMFL
ncbi:GntP family permease [Brackiella oedipodis]|uniref:GntP family permease n=1 Tax=Brackiella oedipodis TaxID=124225 RepID=UPI000490668C|nr:GntP family permease [Brackiella oedipodis]